MFLRGNKLALDDEDLKKCFGNLNGVYFLQLYQSFNRSHFFLAYGLGCTEGNTPLPTASCSLHCS